MATDRMALVDVLRKGEDPEADFLQEGAVADPGVDRGGGERPDRGRAVRAQRGADDAA
jgi:hypothetical protein